MKDRSTINQLQLMDNRSITLPISGFREPLVLQPTEERLDGELNYNFLLTDNQNHIYILRAPKPEAETERIRSLIDQELTATFQGPYRYRTIYQQTEFMHYAHSLGIRVVTPLYTDQESMLLPFIDGRQYAHYLLQGGIETTASVLDNLALARRHKLDIGDRWTRNTIVEQSGDIFEVDFDLKLLGDNPCEYDLAQTLYHTLHFSSRREEMLAFIEDYFSSHLANILQYNVHAVIGFLESFVKFFGDREYEGIEGGIEREIEALSGVLKLVKS